MTGAASGPVHDANTVDTFFAGEPNVKVTEAAEHIRQVQMSRMRKIICRHLEQGEASFSPARADRRKRT